jgi:hypothetical protein
MTDRPIIIVDSGILVAYYSARDRGGFFRDLKYILYLDVWV